MATSEHEEPDDERALKTRLGHSDNALVAGLRRCFESGVTRPLAWRIAQLDGLRRLLTTEEQVLEEAVRIDLGKAHEETWLTEIATALQEIDVLRAGLRRWMRVRRAQLPLVLRPGRARVLTEPLGVVVVISPWNYPLNLALVPLAAALAAGNCVALKPSELAPATSKVLGELLPRYLDATAVAVAQGGAHEADALVRSAVDHVLFTGGAATARKVMVAAAAHLTPVTLELGGKSPAIVLSDANIATAARRITWGKFINAGQTCVAPDYVLVEASVEEQFLRACANSIAEFFGTDPQQSRGFARIINDRHQSRLEQLLVDHGGEIVLGGTVDRKERYFSPTIVRSPSLAAPLMGEEIFGPILPVCRIADIEQASAFVAARPTPLALYLFTENSAKVQQLLATTRSGSVAVNATLQQFAVPDLPFGGIGASGFGAYHGRAGFDLFSHRRSVLYRRSRPDVALLYPPYSARRSSILRRIV